MKEARPTSGKVLQALFNILGNMEGRSFLDLFSGTGRVARTARERGACPVAAVEILRSRSRAILPPVPGDRDFVVLTMDVRRGLSLLFRRGYRFDVIFADPPYEEGWPSVLGEILFPSGGGVLAPEGRVIIEHSCRESIPPGEGYHILERRTYGDTVLSFLGAKKEEGN